MNYENGMQTRRTRQILILPKGPKRDPVPSAARNVPREDICRILEVISFVVAMRKTSG